MCLPNRWLALTLRCALLVGCAAGLYVFLGFPQGSLNLSSLIYYTSLSNLACFAYYCWLSVKTAMEISRYGTYGTTTFLPRFKGALVIMVSVTALLYHLLLSSGEFPMLGESIFEISIANFTLHTLTPLLVICDWLLFDKKNAYRWYEPLLWLLIPWGYFGFTVIRAEIGEVIERFGGRYPYFFIDVDVLGWSGALRNALVITVAFTVLGYLFLLIDKLHLEEGRFYISERI